MSANDGRGGVLRHPITRTALAVVLVVVVSALVVRDWRVPVLAGLVTLFAVPVILERGLTKGR